MYISPCLCLLLLPFQEICKIYSAIPQQMELFMKMSKSSILHINLSGLANPIQRIQVCSKFKDTVNPIFISEWRCCFVERLDWDLSRDNEGLFSYDGMNLTWQWWMTLLHWYKSIFPHIENSEEIQSGAVAKSYMRKGFPIYEEMGKYFPIYKEAVSYIWLCNCSILNFLIYGEILIFFFISVGWTGSFTWQWGLFLIWWRNSHVTMIDDSVRLNWISHLTLGPVSYAGEKLTWQWWRTLLGWTGSLTWKWGFFLIRWSKSHLTMMEDSVRLDCISHLTMRACSHMMEWISRDNDGGVC